MSTTGKFLQLRTGAGLGTVFVPRTVSWTAQETGEVLDATSAAGDGYEDNDNGVNGVEVSVEILHDTADGAFPTIGKGQLIAGLRCYADRNQTRAADYYLPVGIVSDVSRPVEVRGQIKASFKVRNKGYFERDGVAARL